ncbi:MAG TPA: DinB family protein [Tepidisphaeraceae bacterium]|jgi:uncharacterized damage-inducible protein DinB|nr:DinB family protein [Tepidisphaeraceae bacterium]
MNFQRLPDYLRWANRRMLESMKTAPALEARAWEIAAHLLEAESLWLERLHSRLSSANSWPKQFSPADFPDIIERNATRYAQYIERLGSSNPLITYTNTAGETYSNLAQDILAHVFSHGCYHRGQIAALIKRGGGTPVLTDYIFFIREQS